jgi:hypothetical protein
MNGLPNPVSAVATAPVPSADTAAFDEVLSLLRADQDTGASAGGTLEQDPVDGTLYYAMEPEERTTEGYMRLCALLGIDPGVPRVRLTPRGRNVDSDELSLRTRSLMGILQTLSRFVEVPSSHLEDGVVTGGVRPEAKIASLHVRHGRGPRADAFVQVCHRGHWFFIPDSDVRSKRTFALLNYLYSLQTSDVSDKGPLLTVPAGG